MRAKSLVLSAGLLVVMSCGAWSAQPGFTLQEATIDDTQRAIREGAITCKGLVQAYIERAKAYNGICTALITADGKPVTAATGQVRAGAPLKFPTSTVAASSILPDLASYRGKPLEFGYMAPTLSDPSVMQQVGMRVGMPDAGQLNALETLNIRGERSVTCKGKFDAHPSTGPLPAGAPAACEKFRQLPDALEAAEALDRKYGRKPDLAKLPMYCVVMSLKNWYDARDMRATGGNDVNFAMDAPRVDSPDVANLRDKGAIIFAVATANGTDGPSMNDASKVKSVFLAGNTAYGQWAGQACNPYDTERVPRGTSNGSGVSVAANLVACSICEQTSASCKGPASRNNVVNLLTTKGITQDGGLGYSAIGDRAGIHCRTVGDAAKVLDSIKGFDSADLFTSIPKAMIPDKPYADAVVTTRQVAGKPLRGMRVAMVREFMVKHVKNDAAISDQLDGEIKRVLRDRLGAELVESVDPMYPDDPAVPNLKYTFQDAIAEIFPAAVPEFFAQKDDTGGLEFAVPGWDVTSVKYLVALATHKAPLSPKLTLRRLASNLSSPRSAFFINRYLAERGDERVHDWESWVANTLFENDAQRVGFQNSAKLDNVRYEAGRPDYTKMQAVLRMVIEKVMHENHIDVFVNPENTLPPFKLGGPTEPTVNDRGTASCCMGFTAVAGIPEIDVPAGYTQVVYEPQYVLNADRTGYESVTGTVPSQLPHPMPISMMFWSGAGNDAAAIKVASAYESATHHRKPPPAFGPVPGEPK
jgi:Asp-tRNA(Asn)/Glu-tRNA(Gln) amidotransferase A subunit family amidase